MTPISSIAGVTLATPNLDAMTGFYTAAYGLEQAESGPGGAALKGASGAIPQLRLQDAGHKRLVGITLTLRSRADVDAAARELAAAGVPILAAPHQGPEGWQFQAQDPDANVLTFVAAPAVEPGDAADRPLYLSHVVLNSLQAPALVDFYTSVLGFVVTDAYEKGLLTFLRCDQKQHHCLGIAPGQSAGLNHFAMDCGSIDALMRSVGRMQRAGHTPIWGPGRHGPGGNVFCYFQDPDGFVPELTCDVQQIDDLATWQPRIWPRNAETGNTWGTGGPSPRAVELMSGALPPMDHH